MLQRLYAGLASGPSLNARPHSSRQRIDLLELKHLQGTSPATILTALLASDGKSVELPAKVPVFQAPAFPESEWSQEQKQAKSAYDRQSRLLRKLRDIAEDAVDYYNDYGEHALYLGYPLLALPPTNDRDGMLSNRVLAPMAFTPINLTVRRSAKAGITIEPAAGGADLVQPNPGLLAWIEQQTGVNTDTLFADEAGEDPWRELAEILALLCKAADLDSTTRFTPETALLPVPRTEDLPSQPALLPCAVLGLFPIGNPGLMRDTKWMIENEAQLQNPVRPFLSPEVLINAETEPAPQAAPATPAAPSSLVRDFSENLLVTHADPCQTEAVAHARRSAALVIHGPPGTGKSQTIANVIGDHLARGEKVLFVCDKRTALDVVKYRLDGMGLGPLCGVIHDAQRDRKDLYMGLRGRLENLAQDPLVENPERELAIVNRRLNALHGELREYFSKLQQSGGESNTFHELCGKWLAYRDRAPAELESVEGLTADLLQEHRTDCEEICTRAIAARWPENPFRGRLGATLGTWLGTKPDALRASFDALARISAALDAAIDPACAALEPVRRIAGYPEYLDQIASSLEAIAHARCDAIAAALAKDADYSRWRAELGELAASSSALDHSLERATYLQVKDRLPTLQEATQHVLALEEWGPISGKFIRHFSFGKKKAAAAALSTIAAGWDDASRARAASFYSGLKARYLWTDLLSRVLGREVEGIAPDDTLRAVRDDLPKVLAVLDGVSPHRSEQISTQIFAALSSASTQLPDVIRHCRLMAARARLVAELEAILTRTGLFEKNAVAELSASARSGSAILPLAEKLAAFIPTLDDAVRLQDRLGHLPPSVRHGMSAVAAHGLPWSDAEPTLLASSLSNEIQRRLKEDQTLSTVDSRRVESLFSEFVERTRSKTALVRQKILCHWQERWRSRLLSGTRLNSAGSGLRQRLFIKGQKAMKLRQMIAAGTQVPGGDPLFELCPVWMAGPATVAQIFPRAVLFDVVVFDEASQCRLEEALPVLLRAKRVVIAGDPKQLPPTRFFEKALAESSNTDAETADEVFQQQQSEAEDLLAAALNLNVQEAFLDVHYRSQNEGLIGFSNDAFYDSRLQPIPGHPRNKALQTPIAITHVDGVYAERGNEKEAEAAAELVAELLAESNPPSIGVACFNLNQRDLILEAIDAKAEKDAVFAQRVLEARQRRGRDSFEGLFVKNLENVQGDERDHIIISTTFGLSSQGKFSRNFGALSRAGGERRLNVLVTRARSKIHVLTSIPRSEYTASEEPNRTLNGRQQLYAYLQYAERLQVAFEKWQDEIDAARVGNGPAKCVHEPTARRSSLTESLGNHLRETHAITSTAYWGNDGFCVDLALSHPRLPFDVTVGVLTDFTRYLRTPDPISWEQFRTQVLTDQGWKLHRIWSPGLYRNPEQEIAAIKARHDQASTAAPKSEPETVA